MNTLQKEPHKTPAKDRPKVRIRLKHKGRPVKSLEEFSRLNRESEKK